MAEYGLKVSKPDKDVLSAELADLAMYSRYALFKIKVKGSGTLGPSELATIAHNLGYTPKCFVYKEASIGDNRRYGHFKIEGTIIETPAPDYDVNWYVDDINLYITGVDGLDYSYVIMFDVER